MTHNRKAGSPVLPGQVRPMADDDHAASVPVEQAPGHGLGAVELRDGAGPRVGLEGREALVGQRDAAPGADRAAAAARMVLRGAAPARPQAPSLASRDLFARLAGLGGAWVARHATGPGSGCHGAGDAVCRLGRSCGLAWVCHACRLGGAARPYPTCVAARMAAAGAAAAPGDAARLARAGGDGSGLVGPRARL